ncbi:MAG: hypothetical protein IKN65_07775 [Clostridia bacterium]|nr:hypothetical protein [Clostridia bacterium]
MPPSKQIEQKIIDRDNAFYEYCKINNVKKLQIGSGGNFIQGWFNGDLNTRQNIYFLDLKNNFPFNQIHLIIFFVNII